MIVALARLPLARLVRSPRAWLVVGAWTALAIAVAVVVRAGGQPSGADRALQGSFGRFVLPLLTYAVVGAAVGGTSMRRGIKGLVGLGAAPRQAALATTLVAVVACALAGGVLAVVVCGLAHGAADPPLGRDLVASSWVGALGGAAYAAYFSAGAAFGKGGAVRGMFLVFDFVVGGGAGVGALLTPRGHLVALLGGPPSADLPARASSVALVVLLGAYVALAVAVSRRAA
jgi:hypothetical protein